MDVTVITPSIPNRTSLLGEAICSVANQVDVQPKAHLIGIDLMGEGPAKIRNRLVEAAETEWIAFLDDDDILEPNHFSIVAEHAHEGDLIYTWCSTVGRGNFNPNSHFDELRLMRDGNYIPITVTLKTELFREVGGFDDSRYEDWALWQKLIRAGGKFICVPQVTWTYRFLGGNRTWA